MPPAVSDTNDDQLLHVACTRAAEALLAGYGWQLLLPDQLAEQALGHLHAGVASEPRRAVLHAYCRALYTACSSSEGRARQELGYGELYRYLLGLARPRFHTVADDIVQQALERVYRRFAECRQPGAFLAFALQIMRDVAASGWVTDLTAPGRLQSLDHERGEPAPQVALPDWRAYDPLAVVLDDERRRRIASAAAELQQRYPRARRQVAALLLKYLDDLEDQTIAERLATTVENVYILRCRAVVRLQDDHQWRRLATEFGLAVTDPGAGLAAQNGGS